MKKIIQTLFLKSIGVYVNLLSHVAPKKSLALAYKLFSEPRKGKLILTNLPKTLRRAELNSYNFEENVIQTYTWRGNEEVVFLIHGWESNASRWKKTLKHLEKTGKTIIAIDAPAHGLSSEKQFSVPDYAKFINHIAQKFPPKIIIGHSVGGQASAFYQKNYPHQIEKMILLGAPCDLKIILDSFFKMLGLNKKVYSLFKDYTYERFQINIEDFSTANLLLDCQLNGMIIHDKEDKIVAVTEAHKISKSWKKATYIETHKLGHSLHDEYLYQSIINFITE